VNELKWNTILLMSDHGGLSVVVVVMGWRRSKENTAECMVDKKQNKQIRR